MKRTRASVRLFLPIDVLNDSRTSSVAQLESTCNAGDLGSIPGLGRSPGERKGYPLQYSGLENSMDPVVLGVAESDTTEWLSLSLSNDSKQTLWRPDVCDDWAVCCSYTPSSLAHTLQPGHVGSRVLFRVCGFWSCDPHPPQGCHVDQDSPGHL